MNLLKRSSPLEARYIARWLVGNLKTGAGEKTIINAYARAVAINHYKRLEGGVEINEEHIEIKSKELEQ